MKQLFLFASLIFVAIQALTQAPAFTVGAKNFPESYILAEILAQDLEERGQVRVVRKYGMAGTGILFQALESREVDVYPEYTGTLSTMILKSPAPLTMTELRMRLLERGLQISNPLGFNNSYGISMRRDRAQELGIQKISDLGDHPDLRMTFSYEFMEREDGYPGLIKAYSLSPVRVTRMDHSLVYAAIAESKTDVIEIYTTDSKVKKLDLVILEDDLGYFPKYEGLYLYTNEAVDKLPALPQIVSDFEGRITQDEMIELNGLVELSGKTFSQAAATFTGQEVSETTQDIQLLWKLTKAHSVLVFLPVLLALLVGVPFGIMATRSAFLGRVILVTAGLFQTIPSLALLCFLIPILGIGLLPSMVALFLYALLPIVRSTYSGIIGIEPRYIEVAKVLGMNSSQRLFRVQLPLASLHILSGIQTAAVINVGLATLAAFIGAGGYGSLIVTGLALNDNSIILKGALPAAVMAVVVHFLFELLDRLILPKGLRV